MSAFWAVFLLCSLMTPSQELAIMSSVSKVDVDDTTKSLVKRDLQKRPRHLLSGKLLSRDGVVGGLLGGDGPLGGLLGGDGPLGGLLGTDGAVGGLLGKDGAVGGLLGTDGAVGGLLGADGAVGGLLGTDGALGGLLGADGALGGLLGGDGALGGLLGGDGVLGGLLGGDGAVGGLLDRDGVLGALLDRDGVLRSLLGGDGPLGGLLEKVGILDDLLGKDGLVDHVLDFLIGKKCVLDNLRGGNGGDFTGAKIVNNTLPKISLRSLPGLGHQVGFKTQLLVETRSAQGRVLCTQVEADVLMLVQDKWEALQNDKDCKMLNINIHVRPKAPLLEQPLKRLLTDVLSEMGCDIANTTLNVVSTLLGSRTPTLQLRALGDLPPFSIVNGNAIQLDLNLPIREGGVVASTQGLVPTATLLLATGRPPQLSLSQRTLDVLLEPVQGQGAFNLNITNSMVPNSISLSMAALFPLIPQLARVLPSSLPLELRVRVANESVVAVKGRRATATVQASIDVFSPSLQSSQKPLISLDTDIILNIIPSVSDGKLRTTLTLDSIKVTRAPLRLNPLSISPLAGWLKQVLEAAYVPAINGALSVSVPLPNILNTSFRNAKVDIADADDFPDQTDLRGSCSGGSFISDVI